MRIQLLTAIGAALIATALMPDTPVRAQPAPAASDDPFIWLEQPESPRALDWVHRENARTLGVLQADPRYEAYYREALRIATATDRIPTPAFHGLTDQIDNFWQDRTHVRGLWRRTSLKSYASANPEWRTILDVDALAAAEKANWVYHGADCLQPDERLCLVSLSDSGKDADSVREFDAEAGAFVDGGFHLPDGKQHVTWLDHDTLLVARDWGPGTMTQSGYAFVVKALRRGQSLDQARELVRGTPSDVTVQPAVLRDVDGRIEAALAIRGVSFFDNEYWLLGDAAGLRAQPVRLPLPPRSEIQTTFKGMLLVTLQQDWPEHGLRQGDLFSLDLAALKRDPQTAAPSLVFRPGPRQSIDGLTRTRDHLVMTLMNNVRGEALTWSYQAGRWSQARLDLPANVSLGLGSASSRDDRVFVGVTGFLDPSSLWLANAANGKVERVKSSPARFEAAGLEVEQLQATSTDGTQIPYFVVHRKGLKLDGTNPTLLYAYGGFQISMTPSYSGALGKLWLEHGGVYVLANIRGGGEFGPAWHNAGLKENRQRVFDDYASVAKDLIARKITSPRRLGIEGGSNGGLLMGVTMTQHPELFNAVVVQVPLFDMLRFTQIAAGASWVGEYGDPNIAEQRAYIARYSPYQAIKAGVRYPEPFFVTSTADDRVGPGHARKAAAKMQALGYPFYFYENTEGGHAASANLQETARRQALEFVYLTRKLMD